MSKLYERLERCYKSIVDKIPFRPRLALVLGSGLGDFAERIEIEASIDYHDITDFPVSTVSGHKGRFVFGHIESVPVVIMQGRVHYYEGYAMEDVVLPARLMHLMGAEILFLTNACGSANPAYQAGDFMLLTDHILYSVPNPLIGANAEELGLRFPDMSEVYDKELRKDILAAAKEQGLSLREGVYMQFSGPSFETPQEVKMAHILGADAVGMSTACEAIAGRHCGMRICGISCISNLGAGLSKEPLSDEDVKIVADQAAPRFRKLVTEAIQRMVNC